MTPTFYKRHLLTTEAELYHYGKLSMYDRYNAKYNAELAAIDSKHWIIRWIYNNRRAELVKRIELNKKRIRLAGLALKYGWDMYAVSYARACVND